MVKVKICGITNLSDAKEAVAVGADALGFVFYKKSPRYISPLKAKEIIKQLPKGILKVGVFVNAGEDTIKNTAGLCGLDILQFHGNESAEFCARFSRFKIIKAFRIKDSPDFNKIIKYDTFAYLLDTYFKSKAGGTGKKFNWELIRHRDIIKSPLFLSGGLSARNVARAIKKIKPDWVDVSSSVEISPGKKCGKKVREFINAVKGKGGQRG